MLLNENSISSLAVCGAVKYEILSFDKLYPHLNDTHKKRLGEERYRDIKSLICLAFPYFAGFLPGNISLYARGLDYHMVLKNRLSPVTAALSKEYGGEKFNILVDSAVIPEVLAARLSGLCVQGRNGLAILEPYGSFIFLGFITSDIELDDTGSDAGFCTGCGRCTKACPTGALTSSGKYDMCLSGITQKKGFLSKEETAFLRAHKLIWGCDECQTCCPYNKSPKVTDIEEFKNLISFLSPGDLEGISERGIKEKYVNRAFTYRGAEILRRNLEINNPPF
jgi:epoxyqueuosine reductase QueG